MIQKKIKGVSVVVVFCALLLFFCGTSSALMIEKGLSELTTDAEVILEGKVASIKSERSDHPRAGIVTNVEIEVVDIVKGKLKEGAGVTVQILGGELPDEDIGLRVSDQPKFKLGERTFLFLKQDNRKKLFVTVGSFQGKMNIADGRVYCKGEKIDIKSFKERIVNIISGGMDIK